MERNEPTRRRDVRPPCPLRVLGVSVWQQLRVVPGDSDAPRDPGAQVRGDGIGELVERSGAVPTVGTHGTNAKSKR